MIYYISRTPNYWLLHKVQCINKVFCDSYWLLFVIYIIYLLPLITDCFTKPRNRERGVTVCYTLNLKIGPNKKWHCSQLRPPSRKNFYLPPYLSSDFFLIANNRRLTPHAKRLDSPYIIRIAWTRLYPYHTGESHTPSRLPLSIYLLFFLICFLFSKIIHYKKLYAWHVRIGVNPQFFSFYI